MLLVVMLVVVARRWTACGLLSAMQHIGYSTTMSGISIYTMSAKL